MATPHSRNEEILMSIIGGTPYRKKPLSREEYLLIKLKEVIEAGGGGLTPEQIEKLKEQIVEACKELFEPLWFQGTRAEWNALTRAEKSKYPYLLLLDEDKIYKYNKTTNRIDLVVNGDQSFVENMIAPVETTQAKKAHAVDDIIIVITYDAEKKPVSKEFLKVKKPIAAGDTLISGDNVEPWGYDTIAEALPESISISDIDDMIDNLP